MIRLLLGALDKMFNLGEPLFFVRKAAVEELIDEPDGSEEDDNGKLALVDANEESSGTSGSSFFFFRFLVVAMLRTIGSISVAGPTKLLIPLVPGVELLAGLCSDNRSDAILIEVKQMNQDVDNVVW